MDPIFAVVTSVPDAPDSNNICDPYRPYYAVNLRLLDENLTIDEKQPEFEAVPVSMQGGSGMEKGSLRLPIPGTVVEIAYGYGKQSLMFVRSIMPYRLSLPIITSDSVCIQQNFEAYLEFDRAGNNYRRTNMVIEDEAAEHVFKCINKLRTIVNEVSDIKGVSTKKVHGIYRRIAGAIKLLTTGSANYGAAFNVNITAGQDINETAGNNYNAKINKDSSLQVGKNINHTAAGTASYQSPKNWIGSGAENLFKLVSEFMEATISGLTVLASHTHPKVDKIDQGSAVEAEAKKIDAQKTRLDPMIKS